MLILPILWKHRAGSCVGTAILVVTIRHGLVSVDSLKARLVNLDNSAGTQVPCTPETATLLPLVLGVSVRTRMCIFTYESSRLLLLHPAI